MQELVFDLVYPRCDHFNINTHPVPAAYNSRRIITTMRNRKVVLLEGQKGFTRVGYFNFFVGKVMEQIRQQVTAGQVLQSFMRMRNTTLQRYFGKEKRFGLFNFPDTQPGGFVDILLIKQRHA